MLSTFAGYFGAIGSDVLAVGQSMLSLIGDLISGAGPGGYGGAYPPGQYPLT